MASLGLTGRRGSAVNLDKAPSASKPRRLSKPRTNTSSTTSLTRTASSVELSASPSSLQHIAPEPTPGSRRDSRQELRAHLFGRCDELDNKVSSEDVSATGGGVAPPSHGVKKRLSLTTMMLQRRTSSRLSLSPGIKSPSGLSLLPENALSEDEDSDRVLDEIKEKVAHDNMLALQRISSPTDEDGAMSPYRRRTLLTPGLATRVPDDLFRKPPAQSSSAPGECDHDGHASNHLVEFSPLSRLAALDLANGGASPGPRATTPAGLDYTCLGGLTLGTLRIMNGHASPAPSICVPSLAAQRSTPNLKTHDGFFTASEGERGDEEVAVPVLKETNRRSGEFVDFLDAPQGVDGHKGDLGSARRGVASEPNTAKARSGSPLKYQTWHDESSSDEGLEMPSPRMSRTKKRMLAQKARKSEVRDMATLAAQEYIAVLPDSPYSLEENLRSSPPRLEATSKAIFEFEDETFDEPSQPSSPGADGQWKLFLGVVEGAQHGFGSFEEDTLRTLDRISSESIRPDEPDCPSSAEAIPTSEPDGSTTSASGLAKTDSGYSSNTSRRSGRVQPLAELEQRMLERESQSTPHDNHQDIPSRGRTPERPALLNVPIPIASDFSLDSHTQTSFAKITGEATIGGSSPSSPVMVRKLQKPRPRSQPPPASHITVQQFRKIGHVPAVPADVAARHAARLAKFPFLEHTFPKLQATDTGDDLALVEIRFPSPTRSGYTEHHKAPQRNMGESSKPPEATPSPRPITDRFSSFSPFARSFKGEKGASFQSDPKRDNATSVIADFGDGVDPRGENSQHGARPHGRAPSTRMSLAHSHQFAAAMASSAGMDEEQAAELARVRSQDSQNTARDIGSKRDIPMPRRTPIPQSAYAPFTSSPPPQPFNDRGGIPGKVPHVRSHAHDTPPIPALPSPEQVQQKEALVSRTRASRANSLTPPHKAVHRTKAPATDEDISEAGTVDAVDWDAPHKAWSSRRPSSGEAARKLRNRAHEPSLSAHPDGRPSLAARPASTEPHDKLAAHRANLSIQQGHVQRLSGRFEGNRFEGGVGYGYEAGQVAGGSAGMREVRLGTGRNSAQVRRGVWGRFK